MPAVILGGGLAGISLAYFYKGESVILEKQEITGGLCRSYDFNGVKWDVGPHIIFSKNREILDLHAALADTQQIKRSNQILYRGRFVKYPFENHLSVLPEEDKSYCLKEFLHNPYEKMAPSNMLQFFLTTFGEGITRLYLQTYNEKIWKFDPAYMDTQMVERIPKPPREAIIDSAAGKDSEGYLHQLYFHYPKTGGIETLVRGYEAKLQESKKAKILTSTSIRSLTRKEGTWQVETNHGRFATNQLVNCIPVFELFKYLNPPDSVRTALAEMKYNSIYIAVIQCREDTFGDNFAVMVPDKDIIFHRLSKLNFLGDAYKLPGGGSTFLVEVTYRPQSYLAGLDKEEIKRTIIADMEKLNIIKASDVVDSTIQSSQYAYVIYDINHRKNTDFVLGYLRENGIESCGRFAEMEYLNTDAVAERAQLLASRLV